MKTNYLRHSLLLFAAIAVTMNSCEKSPTPEPLSPLADFSQTNSGLSVTFTNSSTNTVTASTYFWDFGDESTSTETSPVHAYSKYGTYTVKLVVANDANIKDSLVQEITISKTSVVKLDDNSLADWDNIPAIYTNSDPENLLNSAKLDYDAKYIYFYIETSAVGPKDSVISVSFNLDNDSTTGYRSWYVKGSGQAADLYSEGIFFTSALWAIRSYKNSADNTAWNWMDLSGYDGYLTSGHFVTSGNVRKYEFGILKSKLSITAADEGSLTESLGDKVGITLLQYRDWGPAGGFTYSLDLTK